MGKRGSLWGGDDNSAANPIFTQPAGAAAGVGQATMAASAPVVIASDQSAVPTALLPAAGEALSNVAASATNVTLLAANAARRGATIVNDGSANLMVKFGATASATSFTVKIPAGGYYELPLPIYVGIIDGIWDVANGSARLTEAT